MSGPYGVEQVEEIKLTVPALVTYSRVARLAVTGLASRMGFSYDEIEDLRIAVAEMCGLLLDNRTGRLTFRCLLTDDALEVEASRTPVGEPPVASDLSRQILLAVVDVFEIFPEEARVRVIKRRQD